MWYQKILEELPKREKCLRKGQFVFLETNKMFPHICELLTGTEYDCFYDDDRILKFLQRVTLLLEDTMSRMDKEEFKFLYPNMPEQNPLTEEEKTKLRSLLKQYEESPKSVHKSVCSREIFDAICSAFITVQNNLQNGDVNEKAWDFLNKVGLYPSDWEGAYQKLYENVQIA